MSPLRILSGLALTGLIAILPIACGDDDGSSDSSSSTTTSSSSGMDACMFDAEGGFGPFGDICMAQSGDDACVTCARANCCTEVQACEGTECACLFECFLEPTCPAPQCLLECPTEGAEAQAVISCALDKCGSECGAM